MKHRSFFLIFLSFCIVLLSQRAMAVTYRVSPSGDDNNPGTSKQRAWRTIDKVNAVDLNPGDRVLFEAGHDYSGNLLLTAEDAGTPAQPVVIGSYGSGRARIKAGNGSGATVRNAGGVEIKDLIVIGDDYKTNIGSGIKIVNELLGNQKLEYIRVHNIEASGFGRRRSSEGFQWPNGCGIFVGGNPSDKSMSGYKNVYITNCTTYRNEYFGILTVGYAETVPDTYANVNVYVGYCKAYDNPGDPDYLENLSGNGILMCDAYGGIIEYCEAYNNGYDCRSESGPVGIWATESNGVTIQYCESHHNRTGRSDGSGFDFDGGTTNSIMQYNYSHDNDGAGYLIYSYENAPHTDKNSILRYNISANDGHKRAAGIALLNGSPIDNPIYNTQIYGNTVYASSRPALRIGKNGIYNTKVCNNLFITNNRQKLLAGNTDKSMVTFAGNAYWAIDGNYDIAGYKSLEAWRKATGQEMLNEKPVGLAVDPKLIGIGTSVTTGDPTKLHTMTAYRLQKDSQLIDAGIDIRSQFGIGPGSRDFYGNPIPQGEEFDIGAHEIPLQKTVTKGLKSSEVTSGEIENLKRKVEQFLRLDQSNPMTRDSHVYYNITVDLVRHDGLLDLAERVVTKGISVNTLENLSETQPNRSMSSLEHQQKLEFSRLYGQYAWILWRKDQPKKALDAITKAMGYVSSPTPEDCLRLGIIEYGNGKKEQGWDHITEALLNDTIVEEQDPAYGTAIEKVIKDKYGREEDFRAFIGEYRWRNAQMFPNLSLVTLEDTPIDIRGFDGYIMFINFFSPICGTCQQEIPSLRNLYNRFLPQDNVIFVFVLTQPDLRQEAIALFKECGIDKPIIAVVRNGSVWDFIPSEPTIWIRDKVGRVVFKHSGYKRGDELIYEHLIGD